VHGWNSLWEEDETSGCFPVSLEMVTCGKISPPQFEGKKSFKGSDILNNCASWMCRVHIHIFQSNAYNLSVLSRITDIPILCGLNVKKIELQAVSLSQSTQAFLRVS